MKHVTLLRLMAAGTSLLLPALAQAQTEILQRDTTKTGAVTFLQLAATGANRRAATDAATTLRSLLKLRTQDELRPLASHSDDLGFTHTQHMQYYKGVPVEYGTYVVHARNGSIETLNGEVIKIGMLDATATLSEQAALARAMESIGASVYRWQVPTEEKALRTFKNNPAATYYPKGELLVSHDETVAAGARLAYKFAIFAQQPSSATYVYVDARSGQVFRKIPVTQDTNAPATAATRYSGTQSIVTDQVSGTSYRLRETGRGSGATIGSGSASIETYNANHVRPPSVTLDITNNMTYWSNNTALDAHWAGEKAYDYFRNTFGYNSWDGAGGTITIYTNETDGDNAYWDNQNHFVSLFNGNTHFNAVTSLDMVGHEIAHGYTQTLINSDLSMSEPASINEGLSDIWGSCIEFSAAPNKQTWLLAEDIMKSGFSCLRNLANPNAGFDPAFTGNNGYPDTYQGSFYDFRISPDPHVNGTIIGHCFYLLAIGANSQNSAGTYYSVTGVGIAKAAQILFRAEREHYFSSTSGFAEVRRAMLTAAGELYGCSSAEVAATANAWFAVGVGEAAPYVAGLDKIVPGNTATYTVQNKPANSTSVSWSSSNTSIATIDPSTGVAQSGTCGSGSVVFTASYSNACGPVALTRTVQLNAEPVGYYTCGANGGGPLTTYQYLGITNPEGADVGMFIPNTPYTYRFKSDMAGLYLTNTTGTSTHFILKPGQGTTITVTSINAPCTITGRFTFIASNSGYRYAIAPNPVSSELTMTAIEDTQPTGTSTGSAVPPFDADLYDGQGRKVKSQHSDHGKVVIDVRDLPNGLYNLRSGKGKDAISEHIQITH